ncbi:flagellin [Modestobacter sp. VKM Ac-2983]|uniref:flagellin N-terminal helical domain-containing protein n=1 Tax=Modestobacter sp. VKM Ac-2983 TaxID=3004137 RepID=UPI0022ABC0DB|nr:flagellin [Modestobacter sp. VKM Ac-2983]MCZ2804181.1 flagellin [Modestobacter sp. VKM Ac-2983]
MSLVVNSNIAGLNSTRVLGIVDRQQSTSIERLSSGLRINRAADDAASLGIAEGLRTQIGGFRVALRNSQDGISVLQTAEGALTETHSLLHRMRDLAVQAANTGGLDDAARANVQTEIGQLRAELDRIAKTTSFNGRQLLDGSYRGTFQVGADAGHTISVGFGPAMSAAGLGVAGVDVTAPAGTATALAAIDAAIGQVSTARADLGAAQNRFEHNIAKVGVALDNTAASESRIRDADIASEMTTMSRTSILTQAGTAMAAQANQSPRGVLQLLR